MFAEKSVIFNFCEILFQIKDDLHKKLDEGDSVISENGFLTVQLVLFIIYSIQ